MSIRKNLAKPFKAAKAFDKKFDETKVGGAVNKGLGSFNKAVGRVIYPRNRAANLAVDVGLFAGMGVIAGLTAASGGLLLPVIGGIGAAFALGSTAMDANDLRKAHKAKKNPPSAGPV